MNIKDLKVLDVVDVYVKGNHSYGRGVVVHVYTSGGLPGARIVGTSGRLNEVWDIHIKDNSALVYVYPRRELDAREEIESGRHESSS